MPVGTIGWSVVAIEPDPLTPVPLAAIVSAAMASPLVLPRHCVGRACPATADAGVPPLTDKLVAPLASCLAQRDGIKNLPAIVLLPCPSR